MAEILIKIKDSDDTVRYSVEVVGLEDGQEETAAVIVAKSATDFLMAFRREVYKNLVAKVAEEFEQHLNKE